MSTEVSVLISAAVATLVQSFKIGGMDRRWGVLSTAIISLVVVLIYAFSNEAAYSRTLLWPYFSGWAAVTGTAVGIHSAGKNTKQLMQGTKDITVTDTARFSSGTGTGD